MRNTTTENTISALLTTLFSIEGIPNKIVSDNGPQLSSENFEQLCIKADIWHITTTPFHPVKWLDETFR